MLFAIERCVLRGSRCIRRFCSKSLDILTRDKQEFILQPEDDFTSVRREGRRILKIAMLGSPNVGKSTLVNQLIKRSVCPVSSKVHTTQAKAHAIYCKDDTQLIFIDTPGMVSPAECTKYKLGGNFVRDPQLSLKVADVVGIVQDAHNVYTRDKIDPNILSLLTKDVRNIPMILIFNKVDKLKKKDVLLHLATVLSKSKNSPDFIDIFMVSALTGDGIDDLRTYLLDSAKPGDWYYEEHMYSSNACEDIIQQTVRAKLLDNLPNQVPYILKVKLEHFDLGSDDSISALVSVTCPKKRLASFVLKGGGRKLKTIASTAEEELRHAFRTPVRLKISVLTAE